MAITLDQSFATVAGTTSFKPNIGTGATLLVVCCGCISTTSISGVTHDGNAMTQAVFQDQTVRTYIWYIINPTQGKRTVAISGALSAVVMPSLAISFFGTDTGTVLGNTIGDGNESGAGTDIDLPLISTRTDSVIISYCASLINAAPGTHTWDNLPIKRLDDTWTQFGSEARISAGEENGGHIRQYDEGVTFSVSSNVESMVRAEFYDTLGVDATVIDPAAGLIPYERERSTTAAI